MQTTLAFHLSSIKISILSSLHQKERERRRRRRRRRRMAFWNIKDGSSLIQVVLITIGVITGTIVMIIILLMTFKYAPWRHQQPLLLKLQGFSITNLNTSYSLSQASFHTTLLFANQNSQLDISIPTFQTLLFFNHSSGKSQRNLLYPISCSEVDTIHLGPKKQRVVEVLYDGTQCGGEQPFMEEDVLEEMRREGMNGVLRINAGLDLKVKYRTGILFWEYELKPKCPTLSVKFVAPSGVGWLDDDAPILCSTKFPN